MTDKGISTLDEHHVSDILRLTGISQYMKRTPCSRTATPYTGADGNNWKNDCANPVGSLLPLGSYTTCHLDSSCTAVDCCVDSTSLDLTFNGYVRLDPCNYKIFIGLEGIDLDYTLIDFSFGTVQHYAMNEVFNLDFVADDLTANKVYVVSINILKSCEEYVELPVLQFGTICHLYSSCTGVTCCSSFPRINRNVNTQLRLDPCKREMTIGIEKLEITISLFGYTYGEVVKVKLHGVIGLEFKIENFEIERKFMVNLEITVCMETNGTCEITVPILISTALPKAICEWKNDYVQAALPKPPCEWKNDYVQAGKQLVNPILISTALPKAPCEWKNDYVQAGNNYPYLDKYSPIKGNVNGRMIMSKQVNNYPILSTALPKAPCEWKNDYVEAGKNNYSCLDKYSALPKPPCEWKNDYVQAALKVHLRHHEWKGMINVQPYQSQVNNYPYLDSTALPKAPCEWKNDYVQAVQPYQGTMIRNSKQVNNYSYLDSTALPKAPCEWKNDYVQAGKMIMFKQVNNYPYLESTALPKAPCEWKNDYVQAALPKAPCDGRMIMSSRYITIPTLIGKFTPKAPCEWKNDYVQAEEMNGKMNQRYQMNERMNPKISEEIDKIDLRHQEIRSKMNLRYQRNEWKNESKISEGNE
ncbi:unnamed protein product [Mytilus edulis]|uniref:Uncharacterized protein n=1 Tax=Mytilus edulis TaxID=6550 RepID=A0A8S3VER1_MYTED|nr:unnamed protein product [Mytilus edulis]